MARAKYCVWVLVAHVCVATRAGSAWGAAQLAVCSEGVCKSDSLAEAGVVGAQTRLRSDDIVINGAQETLRERVGCDALGKRRLRPVDIPGVTLENALPVYQEWTNRTVAIGGRSHLVAEGSLEWLVHPQWRFTFSRL
jgi:hypothetical protein